MEAEQIQKKLIPILPKTFSFYHLGEVSLSDQETEMRKKGIQGLSLEVQSLDGPKLGFLFLIDRTLDPSVYGELCNIIVSKVASRLETAVVSPPIQVKEKRVLQLLPSLNPLLVTRFEHKFSNQKIPVEMIVYEKQGFGAANA